MFVVVKDWTSILNEHKLHPTVIHTHKCHNLQISLCFSSATHLHIEGYGVVTKHHGSCNTPTVGRAFIILEM